ncbi:28S ribosomal protein S34, mitochondrial-like [Dreissena polymorpha]|uniref:Uncharacterized protein n=1 Tax=Dreissena polymorpha TaxID=45954 RepID=A0A9D4LT64_DREPO|nr:28S ribosomal protein S34, mitochondrial-like [Dreissena polymorpha]KAH3863740.1 hypothetical protein DPMN_026739 [Dreissena polymorpha]
MPVVNVGRESFFHGKSLYQIARKLKNFGQGRIVIRKKFERYEEPSFYRLTKVIPDLNAKGYNKGVAFGEKIFRGKNMGECKIDAGNKLDWVLVPRDQEQTILDSVKKVYPETVKVVPAAVPIPPTMQLFVSQELAAYGFKVETDFFVTRRKIAFSKFNNSKLDKGRVPVPEMYQKAKNSLPTQETKT